MKELSLKQAHAISCGLKREVALLKASVPVPYMSVFANSFVDIDEAVADKYAKTAAIYKDVFCLEALCLKMRSLIGTANASPIPFLQSTTIRNLIEEQLVRKTTSASLSQFAAAIGSLSESELANAKRINAPDSISTTTIRCFASEAQANEIKLRIKSLMSAIAKNNLVIDKANAVMTIGITDDEFAILERFGLA